MAGKIPDDTKASDIIKIIVQDWINIVNHNPNKKNIHGLICKYSEKSTTSVKNHSHSFINEKAKNSIPKLRKNLLNVTDTDEREKKLNPTAQKNIKGKAILATLKLRPTIHNKDAVIHVPTFDQRITANAEVRDNIQVQTNANTSTETTFELSKIVVIKTQLQKDFGTEEVNLFNKFLNPPFVIEEIACSK